MNIRVDLNYPINDGTEMVFRSPVDCSQVTGLKVYYPWDGAIASKEFVFADAHGNNVGQIANLFAENVAVKVILDVTTSMAFVQNADTNAYLEGRFAELEAGYRHIATVTQDTDEEIQQIDVTADEDGDVFECSEFLVFATFPVGTRQQVYIGPKAYNWIIFEGNGMSVSTQRKWRMSLKHLADGWWSYEGIYTEGLEWQSTLYTLSSIKSQNAVGEKISSLCFWAQGNFPNGTMIEIYGK